jgi:ABC-type cobalt transport system substrate-binding protein
MAGTRDFSLLEKMQATFGAHIVSYSVGMSHSFPGGEVADV